MLGLAYRQGGDRVDVTRDGVILHSFKSAHPMSGLFFDKGQASHRANDSQLGYKRDNYWSLLGHSRETPQTNINDLGDGKGNISCTENRTAPKQKPRLTLDHRKELAALLHKRIHFGKTCPVKGFERGIQPRSG